MLSRSYQEAALRLANLKGEVAAAKTIMAATKPVLKDASSQLEVEHEAKSGKERQREDSSRKTTEDEKKASPEI